MPWLRAAAAPRLRPLASSRMRGSGAYAELLRQRFQKAARRHGFDRRQMPQRTDLFRPPRDGGQMELFGS